MSNLKDKVIIVTGGSGLLGRVIIKDIIKRGGVAINFDINNDADFYCDITDEESIENNIKAVFIQYNQIDGLVNNAYPRTKDWGVNFEEESMDSWRKNVDLQMNSYVAMSKAILKILKNQKSGAIVNMTSIYGVVGNDMSLYEGTKISTVAPYSAIKGGIINFTRYLASYYGPYNVRINCVSPGGIFDHQDPVFVKRYEEKVPMKRMGTPEDIAPTVSFLLSDEAKYITGQNLIVDGGWTAI